MQALGGGSAQSGSPWLLLLLLLLWLMPRGPYQPVVRPQVDGAEIDVVLGTIPLEVLPLLRGPPAEPVFLTSPAMRSRDGRTVPAMLCQPSSASYGITLTLDTIARTLLWRQPEMTCTNPPITAHAWALES